MSWRRNPLFLRPLATMPIEARFALYWVALLAAFVLLGFLMMAGPVAESDRKTENLRNQIERSH